MFFLSISDLIWRHLSDMIQPSIEFEILNAYLPIQFHNLMNKLKKPTYVTVSMVGRRIGSLRFESWSMSYNFPSKLNP